MADEQQTDFGEVSSDERLLALLMHLLALVSGFIGPLVIWLVKKEESPFLNQHGMEALNFQISALIYFIAAGALTFITCGAAIFLPIAIVVLMWVACIMAAIQGNRGEPCHYPLTIRLLS